MKLCLQCSEVIPHKNKFCNSSCAAKYNNIRRSPESREKQRASVLKRYGKSIISKVCKHCGEQFDASNKPRKVFCNIQCSAAYRADAAKRRFMLGEAKRPTASLKKFIIELKGLQCVECGITDSYNGKHITLEMDHIDGDPSNNNIDNLRILCPNCHSQTHTYRCKGSKKLVKNDIRSTYHRKYKRDNKK